MPGRSISSAVLAALLASSALAQPPSLPARPQMAPDNWQVPRLANGRPDLQGVWTNKSITPFERPEELGTKEFFTPEEAQEFLRRAQERGERDYRSEDVRDGLSAVSGVRGDSGGGGNGSEKMIFMPKP